MSPTATFRPAVAGDLAAVVALLRDDELGVGREVPGLGPYEVAFARIDADPHHLLLVGELDRELVACVQISVLPCLTHGGRTRAQLEGVRVASSQRGAGIGRQLIEAAVAWARDQGCGVVQLTTDAARPDARRFYESLGFAATHVGLKRTIEVDVSRS